MKLNINSQDHCVTYQYFDEILIQILIRGFQYLTIVKKIKFGKWAKATLVKRMKY